MLREHSGLPRTTMYYHLKTMIDRGLISKRKRGQYHVAFEKRTAFLSACVLTMWDVIEANTYQSDWNRQFEVSK